MASELITGCGTFQWHHNETMNWIARRGGAIVTEDELELYRNNEIDFFLSLSSSLSFLIKKLSRVVWRTLPAFSKQFDADSSIVAKMSCDSIKDMQLQRLPCSPSLKSPSKHMSGTSTSQRFANFSHEAENPEQLGWCYWFVWSESAFQVSITVRHTLASAFEDLISLPTNPSTSERHKRKI